MLRLFNAEVRVQFRKTDRYTGRDRDTQRERERDRERHCSYTVPESLITVHLSFCFSEKLDTTG